MEETLREILKEIKEIKVSNRNFGTEQKKLAKEVSDIKTLLTKGAYVDIQKLEKRIEILEMKNHLKQTSA